jgi:hypothetical protein
MDAISQESMTLTLLIRGQDRAESGAIGAGWGQEVSSVSRSEESMTLTLLIGEVKNQ